jgi:hypothetical protein
MSIREEHEETKSAMGDELRAMIRQVVSEFTSLERERLEPAYKAELLDEKKKREQLERRVNELVEENKKSRAMAEQAERYANIRSELLKHGVMKVDLAFKALKDDVVRASDGRLVVRRPEGETGLEEYVEAFVQENPELLPARISGGSGVTSPQRTVPVASSGAGAIDLERIRPGMDPADLARIREEVARMAQQALSGRTA